MSENETPLDSTTFSLMAEFLAHLSPEVVGRSANLSDDEKAMLSRFAKGELTDAQRAELMPLLSDNPEAVSLLASLAK